MLARSTYKVTAGHCKHFGLEVSHWKFLEAEFPPDARVSTLSSLELLELINCAVGLSSQSRDTAQQEEEEEHAYSN